METEPNRPLEANCCTWEEGAWPRWECQSAREGKEETAATAVATNNALKCIIVIYLYERYLLITILNLYN